MMVTISGNLKEFRNFDAFMRYAKKTKDELKDQINEVIASYDDLSDDVIFTLSRTVEKLSKKKRDINNTINVEQRKMRNKGLI